MIMLSRQHCVNWHTVKTAVDLDFRLRTGSSWHDFRTILHALLWNDVNTVHDLLLDLGHWHTPDLLHDWIRHALLWYMLSHLHDALLDPGLAHRQSALPVGTTFGSFGPFGPLSNVNCLLLQVFRKL